MQIKKYADKKRGAEIERWGKCSQKRNAEIERGENAVKKRNAEIEHCGKCRQIGC